MPTVNDRPGFQQFPWRSSLMLVVVVFLVDVLVMGLVGWLSIPSVFLKAVLDGTILVLFLSPAFYLIVVKPLLKNIEQKSRIASDLKDTIEIFRAMVLGSTDGMLLVDREGKIRFANLSAEVLLEKPTKVILGQALGLPLVVGQVRELDIFRKSGAGVAEMRVLETRWYGESAYLVILRDVTEIVNAREQLREQSIHDELTGLHNRRGFFTVAEHQIKTARRTGNQVLVYFIDLDGLKTINDELGHDEGDNALRDAASVVCKSFRESDVIARLGGDEFVALCIAFEGFDQAWTADRIKACLDELNRADGRNYRLSLSVGSAVYDPCSSESLEQIVKRADTAMYSHKRSKGESRTQAVVR